jgi:hypothetical protein
MNVNEIATKGDLEDLKAEILKAIEKCSPGAGGRQTKWGKSKDVMKMLSLSNGGLQTLRINGTIPYSKLGGIIYYDIEDIEKLMIKNKKNVVQ